MNIVANAAAHADADRRHTYMDVMKCDKAMILLLYVTRFTEEGFLSFIPLISEI